MQVTVQALVVQYKARWQGEHAQQMGRMHGESHVMLHDASCASRA
jgi:hypothetical protein